jgi:hypothetical protein
MTEGKTPRPWLWLRALAVVLALFALGHTLGTAAPHVTRGSREALVFAGMQGFRFPVMGFERSYWDFYRGFALTISVLQAVMAAVAWQLAAVSRVNARVALPIAVTLLAGCVGLVVLSWTFFFAPPIVFSAVAAGCAARAVVLLRGRGQEEQARAV